MESCEGKQILSRNEAEDMIRRVGRDKGKDMRAYKCPICFGWHLTKKRERNKRY